MRARHADLGAVEQIEDGAEILGQRRLDIGPGAEDDQRHAVALAALDEAAYHLANPFEPLLARAVRRGEVAGIHRAGDVDGEHHVARGLGDLDRLADPLGPGERQQHEEPDGDGGGHLQACARQHHRAGAGLGAGGIDDVAEEGEAQRRHPLPMRRHEPEHEERQRQEQQRPGRAERNHGPAPARCRRTQCAAIAPRPGRGAASAR